MLQIKHICKEYRTGNLVQKALDDVSLNLRDNEFVAILGPSGSGKTTLLNIIGGLDRYDSGDLIINEISTKNYKDRDWDSYRNHTIGFVFQSYNLIPHQTILANVELALTISGVGKAERRNRAQKALEQVGLGEQVHKKPNQLSGGQMQRVAIARALVNDPDILLADEPTGALDSETSVQVMDLLREVARDRLVVMVTHNPELAQEYATRIVNLKDGSIRSDTNPFVVEETDKGKPVHKNMGKSSMSFLTALSLSFNNLRTKKARTLLTSFAGSIGIIGIALILSLSTGVNAYIQNVEEETLSQYPLQIQSTGIDLSSMMLSNAGGEGEKSGDVKVIQMVTDMFSTMDSNDLKSLRAYLEGGKSGIEAYANAVEYSYNVVPQIYRQEGDGVRQVHPDKSFDSLGFGSSAGSNSLMSSMMSTDVFYEMPENEDLYKGQYEVKAGRWPESYNECVVVLTSGGGISDFMLYSLGLRDAMELDEMIQAFINEEDVQAPENMGTYSYEDLIGISFKLVDSGDYYQYDSQYKVWTDKTDNEEYMENLVSQGEDMQVVGVVQPSEDANAMSLSVGIGYPASLTRHVAQQAEEKEIVKQQLAHRDVDVFTGNAFGEEQEQKGLETESLFTVDADALGNAIQFDESAFSQAMSGGMDLGAAFQSGGNTLKLPQNMDLSGLALNVPDMPQMNLEELLGGLDLSLSPEGMGQAAASLLEGYQEYAKTHPEADYSKLGEAFLGYLQTQEAGNILEEGIRDIIQNSGGFTISTEQLQAMFLEVMTGFQQYVTDMGYTDSENFDQYLLEYLQTPQAQEILRRWCGELFQISYIEIPEESLKSLAANLTEGYGQYAAANGLPNPSDMGASFADYLGTEDGQNRLSQSVANIVDMESVKQQLSASASTYMEEVMGSYTGAISQAVETQISSAMEQVMAQVSQNLEAAMTQAMTQVGASLQETMGSAMSIDTEAFANAFEMNMSEEELTELLMSMSSRENASYEGNLQKLGYVDFDMPSEIDIYPQNFESKEQIVEILDDYNSRMEAQGKEEQVITYTDVVGTLMSSVTDIVDIISYVLIAFVAISLVVSSIMIGVITYISVLERKKEIGILRAIGASKGNISQVFNAETVIIGLCAGLIGIGLSLLLLIPGNALIHHLAGTNEVSAVLPVLPGIILILLSVVLTLLGGLIPSRKAAKSDPVTALRTE